MALINNSRNSFQNKVGPQKSAFFEISIEIKSAQQVSCSQSLVFDTRNSSSHLHLLLFRAGLGPRATCRGAVIGINWGGARGSRSAAGWCMGAQQAMEGERDTAHQPCHGSAAAPLLGFRRELLMADGWRKACDWKSVVGCCIFRISIEILREIKCSWREIRCSK